MYMVRARGAGRNEGKEMNRIIKKSILGEDIPALVIGPLVIWWWPKLSISTRTGAVQRMGSIRIK